MNIEISSIDKRQKKTLFNIYQLYIYELARYFDAALNMDGLFSFNRGHLEKYWDKKGVHWPYFIHVNGELAGFCLLRKYPYNDQRYDIEQFFVLSRYQGQGIGSSVFNLLLEQYPGKWQIRVMEANLPALEFWTKCIAKKTTKSSRELEVEFGANMHFIRFGLIAKK